MSEDRPDPRLWEYREAHNQYRQIDTRIWAIHGLYLAGSAAAIKMGLEGSLGQTATCWLALVVVFLSICKELVVVHLIQVSDTIQKYMREIEREVPELGLSSWVKCKMQHRAAWLKARYIMPVLTAANAVFWGLLVLCADGNVCHRRCSACDGLLVLAILACTSTCVVAIVHFVCSGHDCSHRRSSVSASRPPAP